MSTWQPGRPPLGFSALGDKYCPQHFGEEFFSGSSGGCQFLSKEAWCKLILRTLGIVLIEMGRKKKDPRASAPPSQSGEPSGLSSNPAES